jgi:hypothetical protein
LFGEELISGTISDEDFDTSENWLFDETFDENSFDI